MGRVVRHAGHPLDHLSDKLQGPHLILIAVRFCAFDQFAFDLNEWVSGQPRQPPRTTGATQSISATPAPRGASARNDLMRDTYLACYVGWNHAFFEQVRRAHTPLLHGGEIAPQPDAPARRSAHALVTGILVISECCTNRYVSGSPVPGVLRSGLFRPHEPAHNGAHEPLRRGLRRRRRGALV